ncbi:MAG: hypothetical protein U0103_29325 [Candidatus Obscuribacterales bacterium]
MKQCLFAILSLSCLFNTTGAAFGQNNMAENTTEGPKDFHTLIVEPGTSQEVGFGDKLPKNYNLMPFVCSRTNESGSLRIEKNGNFSFQIRPHFGSLSEFDKTKAEKLFGKSQNGANFSTYNLWGYDLRGTNGSEPNIFHLDCEYDREGKLYRYRMRGSGIKRSHWRLVNKK